MLPILANKLQKFITIICILAVYFSCYNPTLHTLCPLSWRSFGPRSSLYNPLVHKESVAAGSERREVMVILTDAKVRGGECHGGKIGGVGWYGSW